MPAAAPEEITRESWLALIVVTAAAFLVVLDVSVVNVALPSIARDLKATSAQLPWVISGYNIALASLLLLAGRTADRRGRRATFTAGLYLFLLGSLLCGIANSPLTLIVARVVQATGGAFLMPASLAMVLPQFPLSRRGVAIGIWGAAGALGAAFGPSVGAVLISTWSWRGIFLVNVPLAALPRRGSAKSSRRWRGIFLVNVPLGLIVAVLARRLVAETRDQSAEGPLDLIGVPVGVAGVALIMYGIVRSEQHGWTDQSVLGLILAGIAVVPLVVWRSTRHPAPLLDLSLFEGRPYSVSTAAFWVYSLAFTAGFFLNSFMFQELWGMSVLKTGFGLTPGPLIAAVTSARLGGMADRIGHRWIVSVGCWVTAAGYLWILLTFTSEQDYVFVYLPSAALIGVGVGATIAGYQSAAMAEVGVDQFASANATLRTFQQVGYAIGISVVSTLAAGFSYDGIYDGFVWVMACFVVSGVVMLIGYPSGSATARQASNP
ncbi:MAG: MFS transporter [Acidimicrobiaceae bacterium]|nr:MFS transporter [Acidimicrobiaceae bacterium]